MAIQERLNRKVRRHIAGLKATASELWKRCCEHENIPTDSKFVVFSDDNPFVSLYNQAVGQLQDAIVQYRAGGYVGLQIVNGKARKI